MNDEMREAFEGIVDYVKSIQKRTNDNDIYIEASSIEVLADKLQAAYQLQQEKIDELEAVLLKARSQILDCKEWLNYPEAAEQTIDRALTKDKS